MRSGFRFGVMVMAASTLLLMRVMVFAQDDLEKHRVCDYCGMDRNKFAYSRVLIEYEDGTRMGTCSIHCAAVDMAVKIDKAVASIQVGDFNTNKLINAEKAVWVLGGDRMGIMTKRAKWAFADKAGAEAFIKKHGGKFADFETVLKASYEDMYQDILMMMRMKK